MDHALEKAFLAELEALEKFRVSYTGMYPNAPLASDDPDVRRLLEALAFFTARTRLAGERNVGESLLRIFRQHFPYLLSPVPAMGMLRATTTRRYVDVTTVPRGTDVNLVKRHDSGGPDELYRFKTLAPLRIVPVAIDGVETFRAPNGVRLAVRMSASFLRNDKLDELDLHIDYLHDLHSSLLVLNELRQHLRSVGVVWSHAIDGVTPTEPCSVSYGAYEPEPAESDFFEHPLHRSRSELHFPQQELFVRVRQIASPRQWQRLTVCFDLGPGWPAGLRLSADCFQLHVVPMMNVRRETADAFEYDATQERHLLHHPDPRGGFVPLSVHAVYRTTSEGLAPLQPAIVGADADSYEAVCEGQGAGRRAWVTVNLPDAFERPETIVADVFWHQPRVSAIRVSDLAVRLSDRFVEGVEWECFGGLAPHADAELEHDRTAMLELLSIKGQRRLGKGELRHLLSAIGVPRERPFAKLLEQLSSVAIVDKPHARKGNGFKHVYELVFDNLTPSDVPRLSLFCAKILDVLGAWCVDDVLELVARVPNLEKVVKFAGREAG